MGSTHNSLTINLVAVAAAKLWLCLGSDCPAGQFTEPFIGMDQVTRNGP
jgi:hypothetical protein